MNTTRSFRSLPSLSLSLLLAGLFQGIAPATAQPAVAPLPQVEGPITGPGIQHPSIRGPLTHAFVDEMPAGTTAADFGYLEEEYFVTGTTAAGQPYRTRIVVRRPSQLSEFSGMVMVEAMHPSNLALIWQGTRIGMMTNGHVGVEIVDQSARVQALQQFNGERYGSLQIPGGQANREVIAQVGRLIQEAFPAGEEWSQAIQAVVLAGTSASATTALQYMSTHHANWRMPDDGTIFDALYVTATAMSIPAYDIPIVHVPTEVEAVAGSNGGAVPAYRRDDGDEPGNQFRQYEVAGMPHIELRESPAIDPASCTQTRANSFMYNALTYAGLAHLFRWTAHGIAPPRAERIRLNGDGIERDVHGNALGGVRSPQLDVPTLRFVVPNSGGNLCNLGGYEIPLADETLQELYEDADDYARQLRLRGYALIREGWFPQEYWHEIEDEISRLGFWAPWPETLAR